MSAFLPALFYYRMNRMKRFSSNVKFYILHLKMQDISCRHTHDLRFAEFLLVPFKTCDQIDHVSRDVVAAPVRRIDGNTAERPRQDSDDFVEGQD